MKSKKERPILPAEINENVVSAAEQFQNEVIRPIIKMQSDLLFAHLSQQLKSSKIKLDQLPDAKKEQSLTSLFEKNQAFKREVLGMIIGQFSMEEYSEYVKMQKELNRRIRQIVLNRVLEQWIWNV
ncbi:glyoxalase [Brumimicrobium salinarum]|uniref:Glyoxalase n=1 Tax=Brumimicrobium salinarum TaxID=2058658 RepID=A0A2I0QZP4_9FLAO|nr:glyoxalase [Brumimicrobium salinarum]PKR79806.1 glyoxalase [Brumimicrobium salinarum]